MPDGTVSIDETVVEEEAVKVRAITISVAVSLSEGRQIQLQSFVPDTASKRDQNAFLDRMLELADRQKFKYELPELETEIEKQVETLENLIVDRERLDKKHAIEQAERKVQLQEMHDTKDAQRREVEASVNADIIKVQTRKAEIEKQARDEWVSRGRQGPYKARGHFEVDIDRHAKVLEELAQVRDAKLREFDEAWQRTVDGIQKDFDKAEEERTFHSENQGISIDRWNKAIAAAHERLAKLKASQED